MKNLFSYVLTAGLLLSLPPPPAQAQDDGGPPIENAPTGATGVPIDGGASLLLAGGVAYGLKKLRARKAR